MDVKNDTGNGFRFDNYDTIALRWGIDRAMDFHALPNEIKDSQIRRVMKESAQEFSHEEVARQYIEIYEQMLARPLVEQEAGEEIS